MSLTDRSTPKTLRLVVADDHHLVRLAITALLSEVRCFDVQVVAEAATGLELVTIVDTLVPDVVLTDLSMPVMDGVEAISRIRQRHPDMRVLVLSMHDSLTQVRHAVSSGASGYILKHAPAFELEQAIASVMHTGSYFSPVIARRLLEEPDSAGLPELTRRQIEILCMLARGRNAKQIAFDLELSEKTVAIHRAQLMKRLQISDIASLTRYALRHGLVRT